MPASWNAEPRTIASMRGARRALGAAILVAMVTGAATAIAEPRVPGVAYWHGVNERLNGSGMRVFTKAPGAMEKVRLVTRYHGETAPANAAIDSTQHHEDIWFLVVVRTAKKCADYKERLVRLRP